MQLDPALHYLIVFLLALVFLQAGVSKLLARDEFEGIVANYRVLPPTLVAPFAALLPYAELGAGLGLLWDVTRSTAALLAAAMLLLFALAMAVNLARGRRDIDCGCFKSALKQTISGWLIGRNVVLATAAVALLLPVASRATGVLDYMTVLAGGAMLFLFHYSAGVLSRRPAMHAGALPAAAAKARTNWKTL
jgi:hypothetical protein